MNTLYTTSAPTSKQFKQDRSLLRTIRNNRGEDGNEIGKAAATVAKNLCGRLRPLELAGLIKYWGGYWFTTVKGREILEVMEAKK